MVTILILAGGLGTRLRSVISDRPKSMAIINGIPFLEYQIKYFKNQNFTDFVICSGYKHEKILEYFHDGYDSSIKILHSTEKEPLGTGGAIKNALNMIPDEKFFVTNGDTITEIDLNYMGKFHATMNADLTMALVRVGDNTRYGNVITDNENRITSFSEKAASDNKFVNAGIYLLNKDSINWYSRPKRFSLEKDILPAAIKEKRVYGYKVGGYFIDIGIPEDFKRFQREVSTCDWLKRF